MKEDNYIATVALVRSSCIYREEQILREAETIAKAGFSIVGVGWDRDGNSLSDKYSNTQISIQLLNKRAPCGNPLVFLYLPIFWSFVLIRLFSIKPNVVHAYDFDSAIPAYIFKKLNRRVHFVFEVYDRYAMAFIPPRYTVPYSVVNFLEELLFSKADLGIVVARRMLSSMRKMNPKRCEIVASCVSKEIISEILPRKHNSPESQIEDKVFTLGYMGCVDVRLKAVLRVLGNDNRLIVTGHVTNQSVLTELKQKPNSYCTGFLPYREYLEVIAKEIDLVLALYDSEIPKNELVYPNKLWESMALGKPIITNIARDVVEETRCGIIVKYDPSDVNRAVERLQNDPAARTVMGERGRYFFEQKYNWENMEQRLLRGYRRMRSNTA